MGAIKSPEQITRQMSFRETMIGMYTVCDFNVSEKLFILAQKQKILIQSNPDACLFLYSKYGSRDLEI